LILPLLDEKELKFLIRFSIRYPLAFARERLVFLWVKKGVQKKEKYSVSLKFPTKKKEKYLIFYESF
jgi:hypothetical protein